MTSQSLAKYEVLDRLADEFVERFRAGERPSLNEYIERHPELATEIRDLLPAMVSVEQVGGERSPGRARPGLPLEKIGDYRIVREVGQGGMGIVYKAMQESLGRRVALKVLPPAFALRERFLERFHREARAAAQLHHTNIVPVFGVGDDGGIYYYAMQFIQGQGLDTVLEDVKRIREHHTTIDTKDQATLAPGEAAARGLLTGHFSPAQPLPAEEAVVRPAPPTATPKVSAHSDLSQQPEGRYFASIARLGIQAADGMGYAHAQGILHRDIKPSNLLLDLHGTLWITDFGLAKAEDSNNLTQAGDIIGTVRYMAPERFDGRSDARSDVYALGVTLYELLTLRPPFTGGDRAGLIGQITNEAPILPSRLVPHLPRDLETIVMKAMARDPAARYATAQGLADDLRRFLENRPIKARRSSAVERLGRWSRRNPAVAALLVAVFVLLASLAVGSTVAAVWLRQERNAVTVAEQEKTDKLFQSLVDQARASRYSQQAGQRFAGLEAIRQAVQIAGERHMPPTQLDELRTLAIGCLALADFRTVKELNFPGPFFHWDNDDHLQWLAGSYLDGRIELYRVSDGRETRLSGMPGGSWLSFSPGGRFLLAEANRRIGVWDLSMTPPRVVLEHEADHNAFYPDGRRLIVQLRDGSLKQFDLLDPRAPGLPSGAWEHGGRPMAFDPSGSKLAILANEQVEILDAQTGKFLAHLPENDPVSNIAWHPRGQVVAVVGASSTIHIWDLQRWRRIAVLAGCRNSGVWLAFTPDGELLISNGWEGKIRFWNWRTGQQVLRHPGASGLRISNDGRMIVRTQIGFNLVEIATGREYRTLVQQSSRSKRVEYAGAAVHPDGRVVAVGMLDGYRLWDLESGEEIAYQALNSIGTVAFASPDTLITNSVDGLLAWPVLRPKQPESEWQIGPPRRLLDGRYSIAACSRDGNVVAQAVGNGAIVLRLDRTDRPVSLQPHADTRRVSVSPDGRRVATGGHNGEGGVKIWEAERARVIRELSTGPLSTGLFSPDGRWLVAGGQGAGRILALDNWEERPIPTFDGASFSPDSSLLALQMQGGIKLLDPVTLLEKARLEDPNQAASASFVFTPDGTRLVVSSTDAQAVHVWDLRLIRQQLAELGLDWDQAPYPPAEPAVTQPLYVKILPGSALSPQPTGADRVQKQAELALYSLLASTAPYHPEAYHQRGHIYDALGEHENATANFTEALRWQPHHPQRQAHLYLYRAGNYERLHREYDAAADLQKVVELQPRNSLAFNNLAQIYANGPETMRDPAKALDFARRGLLVNPADWYCRNSLGLAHYRLGHYAQAIVALERSLRESKGERAAFQLYFLAMCHARLGDAAKARECHDEASHWTPEKTDRLPADWTTRLAAIRTEADAVLAGKVPAH